MRVAPVLATFEEAVAPDGAFRAAAIALAQSSGAERSTLIEELFEARFRSSSEGQERATNIAALRACSPAWDRVIAADEADAAGR